MSTLQAFLASELTRRLGWTLIHSLWIGGAVAVLLALTRLVLGRRSPNARYAAACGALVLLVAASAASFVLMRPAPLGPPDVPEAGPRPYTLDPPPKRTRFPPRFKLRQQKAELQEVPLWERAAGRVEPALPWVCLAWLAGAALLSVRRAGGGWCLWKIRRGARPVTDPHVRGMLADLARSVGVSRPVRLLQTALLRTPAVIGWVRPAILVPASLVTGLPPEQLRALLAHELAHIRRWDYLVNLGQMLVETLLFFNPAVWYVSRRIRRTREECCDDQAVASCGRATVYATALLEAARAGAQPRLAVAAAGGAFVGRIRRILGLPDPRAGHSTTLAVASLAAACVLAALFVLNGLAVAEADAQRRADHEAYIEQMEDWHALQDFCVALYERMPTSYHRPDAGHFIAHKLPVWNWTPPEGPGLLVTLYPMLEAAKPDMPLQIRIWLMDADWPGVRPDVPRHWRSHAPWEIGTWRGRRVLVFGTGETAGWDGWQEDIRAALAETEAPLSRPDPKRGYAQRYMEILREKTKGAGRGDGDHGDPAGRPQ